MPVPASPMASITKEKRALPMTTKRPCSRFLCSGGGGGTTGCIASCALLGARRKAPTSPERDFEVSAPGSASLVIMHPRYASPSGGREAALACPVDRHSMWRNSAPKRRGSKQFCAHDECRRKMTDALVPPKPKEFDKATS